MRDPVVNVECSADGVKVAIVENEKVLVLILQALNRVSDTLGEVPDIADFESINFILAIFIDGRYNDRAGIDEAPFSLYESAMSFKYLKEHTTRCQCSSRIDPLVRCC